MNTPNYILVSNGLAAIEMRDYLTAIGIKDQSYRGWMRTRTAEANLSEGTDFMVATQGKNKRHIVTIPAASKIFGTIHLKSARTQQDNLQGISDSLSSSGIKPVDNLTGFQVERSNTSLFSEPAQLAHDPTSAEVQSDSKPEPSKAVVVPQIAFSLAIPVYQIDGRAAVNGLDLFKHLSDSEERRFNGWMTYRIDRSGLVLGKHFVEYSMAPGPGHRRGSVGYILSLDAAISIADSEMKGLGKGLAQALILFRKELAKLRLSIKGSLSDFIGADPVNVATIEPEPAEVVNAIPEIQESPVQQTIFDENAISSELPASEVVSSQTVDNSDALETPQNGEINNEVVSRISAENTNTEPVVNQNLTDHITKPPIPESPDWVDPEEEQSKGDDIQPPTVFDLLVSFAQNNLQQAQALAKIYRDLVMTQGTVSELVQIEQQAARQKLGLYPGTATIPNVTLRDKINYAVNKRAGITKEKQEDIFKAIYARLANDYGYSVLDMPKKKGQSHLNVCEEMGIISIVWDIVNTAAFNQYLAKRQSA